MLNQNIGEVHQNILGKSGRGPQGRHCSDKVSTNPRLLPFHKHRLDQRRTDEISFVGRLLVSGKALFFNLYAHPILLQGLYSHHVCRVSLFWREFWKGRSTCKGSWTTAKYILVLWRVLCLVVCSVSSSIPYFHCVVFEIPRRDFNNKQMKMQEHVPNTCCSNTNNSSRAILELTKS